MCLCALYTGISEALTFFKRILGCAGFTKRGLPANQATVRNQMEKDVEHEVETGGIKWFLGSEVSINQGSGPR